MDLKSYSRWYDYSRARDEMFAATDTEFAPWHVADSNDKKRARLNIITTCSSRSLTNPHCESPPSFPRARSVAATASPTTRTSTSRRPTEPQRQPVLHALRNPLTVTYVPV